MALQKRGDRHSTHSLQVFCYRCSVTVVENWMEGEGMFFGRKVKKPSGSRSQHVSWQIMSISSTKSSDDCVGSFTGK